MRYSTGVILVVAAGVLWSVQGLIVRQIVAADSWQILVWRSLGMIPVLLIWIKATAPKGALGPEFRGVGKAGAIGGMGLVLAFAGAIYAFQATTVANAVFLFSASPFFAAILGWLVLREAVQRVTWGTIVVAALGILIMVGQGLEGGALLGQIAALISAFGFAVFTVALRWGKLGNMMPSVVLGGVFSALVGSAVLGFGGSTLWVPVADIVISLAMGAVTLAGGMVLYTYGSRAVPAAQATLLSLIEVLLAPFWVWLFISETMTPSTVIGGAVLLVAVVGNAVLGRGEGRAGAGRQA